MNHTYPNPNICTMLPEKNFVVFTLEGYETSLGHIHHTGITQDTSMKKE